MSGLIGQPDSRSGVLGEEKPPDFGTFNGKAYVWKLAGNTFVQGSGEGQFTIAAAGHWANSTPIGYDYYGRAGGNTGAPASDDWIDLSNNEIKLKTNGDHGFLYSFTGYNRWYAYAWDSNGHVSARDTNGSEIQGWSEGNEGTHHKDGKATFHFVVNFSDITAVRFYNVYKSGSYSSLSGGTLEIRRVA